ncbi:hypothetical protein IAU59_001963 [Kwoniella sp. CBS 9459]
MAKAKLKAALANQQYNAARAAAKKRAAAAEEAKKASVKAGLSGVKKGAKRAKTAKASASAGTGVSSSVSKPSGSAVVPVPGSGSGSGFEAAVQAEPSTRLLPDHLLTEEDGNRSASFKGKIKTKPLGTNPFDKTDTILLLGEGNFSFSHSLLLPPHNIPGYQILATAYDSQEVTYRKYPDAQQYVDTLKGRGARVEFGVDAGALEKCKAVGKGRKWSKVVFNFPHVGAGITDQDRNILSNQTMLLRFFRSVEPLLTDGPSTFPSSSTSSRGASSMKKLKGKGKGKGNAKEVRRVNKDSGSEDEDDGMDNIGDEDDDSPYILNEDGITESGKQAGNGAWAVPNLHRQEFTPPKKQGSILLTLLSCPPYTLWTVPKLATRPPHLCPGTHHVQPKYELARSFEFVPSLYEGYEHRRTIGWKDGKSKGANEEILGRKGKARTWEFVRAPPDAESD